MSIEGKHAYRFGYLKSEQWQNVRLEALAREGGKCQVCGQESVFNDAHHVWYPESIYDTTEEHLVVLCRACHELLHALIPGCKTREEAIGKEAWIRFRNAIQNWQIQKKNGPEFAGPVRARELREAYERCKEQLQDYQRRDQKSLISAGSTTEQQLSIVLSIIKGWAKNAMKKNSCGGKE